MKSMQAVSDTVEEKLSRLTRLAGTDEGFYILALHSFIEFYLRYVKGYGEGPTFPELTWSLREEFLVRHGDSFIDNLSCLGRLGKQHYITNKVRHAFENMDPEEAAAATHLFIRFCTLTGLADVPAVHQLEQSLDSWKSKTTLLEQSAVIRGMQKELSSLRERNRDLLAQKKDYEKLKIKLRELKLKLTVNDIEYQKIRTAVEKKDEKVDALRRERNVLLQEKNRLCGELGRFADLEKYLGYLGRLSLYTTTRMDYERTISQLTPEQEEVISGISLKKDFYIRGGAGTGKSLVLIEALRRALSQEELDFGGNETVVFVTFTKTLARYNRYIAELKNMNLPLDVIGTVDTLFYKRLKIIQPEFSFDFGLLDNYFTNLNTPEFFTPAEMVSELENFLFGSAVTEKEYTADIMPRPGMRRRLSRDQRKIVWRHREEATAFMRERKTYSRNYGRLMLYDYLCAHPDDGRIRDISWLFLDEVQDLNPVALMTLRKLTRRALIMAGDADQSLYNQQPPFTRAGLKLTGTTRVLKTNFRNTRQVYRLAETFRKKGNNEETGSAAEPFAFREGPVPELYQAPDAGEITRMLCEKLSIFIDDLQYEPENICILVPRKIEIENLGAALSAAGFGHVNMGDDSFSFADRGRVRLTTLHSSKGLDFPVVFLYLPYLYRLSLYDEEQTDRLLRNLVYVAITRAMDNVNVFMAANGDPVLKDLSDSFR